MHGVDALLEHAPEPRNIRGAREVDRHSDNSDGMCMMKRCCGRRSLGTKAVYMRAVVRRNRCWWSGR